MEEKNPELTPSHKSKQITL